jgi:hypothetical protein
VTTTRAYESNGHAGHGAVVAADATPVDERLARSLEAIATELGMIRALLEEGNPRVPAVPQTGPWFRHASDR